MQPQIKQQTLTNQKIIAMMRITKKTDPLFKPLKKLKTAIQNVGFDKISAHPTRKLLLFHFGLGNDLDRKIILQTQPQKFITKQTQNSYNPIIPGKSYCVLDFKSSEQCQEYLLEKYQKILQNIDFVRYAEIKYENLLRIFICMYVCQDFMSNSQNLDIHDCPQSYSNSIPGIYVVDDFINKKEQIDLLTAIDKGQWQRLNNRRVQHFGYQFKYGRNQIDKDQQYKYQMPQFIHPFLLKLRNLNIIPKQIVNYDQMTINDYFSGDGIPSHFDTHSPFQQYFVAISMLSGIVMQWRRFDGVQQPVYLRQRSLVIFSGEGRYAWTHGISCRKMDKINGQLRHRARRISITLRKIRRQPCICTYYFYCDSQGYDQKTMKKNNSLLKKYLAQKTSHKLQQQPQKIYQKYVVQAYNGFGYNFHNKIIPLVQDILLEIFKTATITDILDVGCGNGQYHQIIQKYNNNQHIHIQYYGMQYCQIMSPCQNLIHMTGLKMCYKPNIFDCVICIAVIHHLTTKQSRLKMLKQIHRILHPNKNAIISCFSYQLKKHIYDKQDIILEYCVPAHKIQQINNQNLPNQQITKQQCRKQQKGQIYQRYYHLFQQQQLKQLLVQAGFQIQKIYYDEENIIAKIKKTYNKSE